MSEKNNKRYSIWGEFDEGSTSAIRQIQEKVNLSLGGPLFKSHLTLSGFFNINSEILEDIQRFSLKQKKILMETHSYGMKDTFFQALYIEIEKSKSLAGLKKDLDKTLLKNNGEFFPHISLFYGLEDESRKQLVIDELPVLPEEILLNKLSIALIEDDIEAWEVIHSFPLVENVTVDNSLGRPI
jgi:hypothetical protein